MTTVVFPVKTWTGERPFKLQAGTIYSCPGDEIKCISLAKEIYGTHYWDHLPIEDFSVPDDPEQVKALIKRMALAMAKGEKLYVGCAGGVGRTGMFLGLLYKALAPADIQEAINPVSWVRQHFKSYAIETMEQKDYVLSFDTSGLGWSIQWAKLLANIRSLVNT